MSPLHHCRVVVKDAAAVAVPLASPPQAPMPDLSSQPLDPDEPTYCLCKQVSFGEMIGCDNEEVVGLGTC